MGLIRKMAANRQAADHSTGMLRLKRLKSGDGGSSAGGKQMRF